MTINADYPQIYISTEIKGVVSFTKSENMAKESSKPRPGMCPLEQGIRRSLVASDRTASYLRKLKDIKRGGNGSRVKNIMKFSREGMFIKSLY